MEINGLGDDIALDIVKPTEYEAHIGFGFQSADLAGNLF
jgi:hypothetical protein